MDIRSMRQLLAVRRHGSFAKAAKALGMSQPSLSTAMARLEDQLKVRLFERSAAGSQLTAVGELIAQRADGLVKQAEQIIRDAELAAGGEAGTIRLGIGTALRQTFLPRLVLTLAEQYPSLSLQIEVLDRDRLVPLVRSRELDVAISSVGDESEVAELSVTEILTSPAMIVAHPDHTLAAEPGVTVDRFSQFPAAGPGLQQYNATRLSLGGPGALFRYQSNDYQPLLELALAGRATLVAPGFVVQPHVAAGALRPIDIDWRFTVSFVAITTRAAAYSPIINRIIDQARSIGRELQDTAAPVAA